MRHCTTKTIFNLPTAASLASADHPLFFRAPLSQSTYIYFQVNARNRRTRPPTLRARAATSAARRGKGRRVSHCVYPQQQLSGPRRNSGGRARAATLIQVRHIALLYVQLWYYGLQLHTVLYIQIP